jgi:hypothetical protein
VSLLASVPLVLDGTGVGLDQMVQHGGLGSRFLQALPQHNSAELRLLLGLLVLRAQLAESLGSALGIVMLLGFQDLDALRNLVRRVRQLVGQRLRVFHQLVDRRLQMLRMNRDENQTAARVISTTIAEHSP